MDDTTKILIESLASKLGTTTEYLWGVLIRQAYISFWTDLLEYAIVVVIAYFSFRITYRLFKSEYDEELPLIISVMVSCFVGIFLVAALFSIGDTITKIANPEYYALKQVLTAAKGK